MRILHVSNWSSPRCGIQNYGYQLSAALRRAGHEVVDWDGAYPAVYAKVQVGEPSYLPEHAEAFDVIHLNWHPVTLNHYQAGHFPPTQVYNGVSALPGFDGLISRRWPIISIYLHDLPPWSGCPFRDRADVLIAAMASPGCQVVPYPVCDWIPDDDFPEPARLFTVGWSGVRGDGVGPTTEACEKLGFATNRPSSVWLTYEDEIRRLARSSVNVCWYLAGRGISGGASQITSARRPMILSNTPMFDHLAPWADQYYQDWAGDSRGLQVLLEEAYADWQAGRMKTPTTVLDGLSWSKGAAQFTAIWEAARRV